MDAALEYLRVGMGLTVRAQSWDESQALPLFLRCSGQFLIVRALERDFLLVQPLETTLPSIKRMYNQLAPLVDRPVAINCPHADARQRKALVAQGIPFICASRQVFLPFLGVAGNEWGSRSKPAALDKLSPRAQQAAIWGALRGAPYTLEELREATGMNASRASETARELTDAGLIMRKKEGRVLHLVPVGVETLLDENMALLSTPVVRTMTVRRDPLVAKLPLAGESALAVKTMLNAPKSEVRAAHRSNVVDLKHLELIEGELPDDQAVRVQVWKYNPLFADCEEVDPISLALSLVEDADERVMGELIGLFGKEYQWEKASR